jgi:hypothetical protein
MNRRIRDYFSKPKGVLSGNTAVYNVPFHKNPEFITVLHFHNLFTHDESSVNVILLEYLLFLIILFINFVSTSKDAFLSFGENILATHFSLHAYF